MSKNPLEEGGWGEGIMHVMETEKDEVGEVGQIGMGKPLFNTLAPGVSREFKPKKTIQSFS